MTGFAYGGYCYSTLNLAVQAQMSYPIATANGLVVPRSFTLGVNTADLTYRYKTFSNASFTDYTINQVYQTCQTLGELASVPGQPTFSDVFAIPLAGDLQTMWMLGFGLSIIAYLTAWGYGVVINWFSDKKRY